MDTKAALRSDGKPYAEEAAVAQAIANGTQEFDEAMIAGYDCTLVITDHECYDYQWIVDNSQLVVDTRNACSGISRGREKVVKA